MALQQCVYQRQDHTLVAGRKENMNEVSVLTEFNQINSYVFWYEIKPRCQMSDRIQMFPVSSAAFWNTNFEV